GVLNCNGSVPRVPTDATERPALSYLTTRELLQPSEMEMLPAASHAMSVGRLNRYGAAGGTGVVVGISPSTISYRRPRTISIRPSGLNLRTVFAPSSTVQMLSCG